MSIDRFGHLWPASPPNFCQLTATPPICSAKASQVPTGRPTQSQASVRPWWHLAFSGWYIWKIKDGQTMSNLSFFLQKPVRIQTMAMAGTSKVLSGLAPGAVGHGGTLPLLRDGTPKAVQVLMVRPRGSGGSSCMANCSNWRILEIWSGPKWWTKMKCNFLGNVLYDTIMYTCWNFLFSGLDAAKMSLPTDDQSLGHRLRHSKRSSGS